LAGQLLAALHEQAVGAPAVRVNNGLLVFVTAAGGAILLRRI